MASGWEPLPYEEVDAACDTCPCARAGAREARGCVRPARAAVPAPGAPADRARLGDPGAAGARRLGCDRARARPARAGGHRRAQRRAWSSASRSRRTGSVSAPSPATCSRPCAGSAARSRSASRCRRRRGRVGSTRTWNTRASTSRRSTRPRRRDPSRAGAGGPPRPYRGRATPVNAWWGRSTSPSASSRASRPSRRRRTSSRATRWTPKRSRSVGGRANLATRARRSTRTPPAPPGLESAQLSPAAARWDSTLGEFVLDWDDVRAEDDPHRAALEFGRSAVRHACAVCGWEPALLASVDGYRRPPPEPLSLPPSSGTPASRSSRGAGGSRGSRRPRGRSPGPA